MGQKHKGLKQKNTDRGMIILVIVMAVVLVFGCTTIIIKNSGKRNQYNKAVEQLNEGYYQSALDTFTELGNYKETEKYTAYCSAIIAGEKGDYAEAVTQLTTLEGFADSSRAANYFTAREEEKNAETADEISKVIGLYSSSEDFSDSAERAGNLREKLEKLNTPEPTAVPTPEPTAEPTQEPAKEEAGEEPATKPSEELTAETTVEPDGVPAAEATTAPETETSDEPATKATAAPEAEASEDPATETTAVLEAEASESPATETTAAPEAEASEDPATETTAVPETEASEDPATETTAAPEAEASAEPATEATVTPEAEVSPEPTAPSVSGTVCNTDNLNIHRNASLNSNVLGGVRNGSIVSIESVLNGWAKITTEQGITGYVSADYLNFDQTAFIDGDDVKKAVVDVDSVLYMREAPDKNSELVRSIPDKTEVLVLEDDGNGWAKISLYGYTGYVVSKYLDMID